MALIERSAALSSGRARILDSRGDGQLTASAGAAPGEPRLLRPDYTLLAGIDGAPQLLFVELQHRAALVRPRSPQYAARKTRRRSERRAPTRERRGARVRDRPAHDDKQGRERRGTQPESRQRHGFQLDPQNDAPQRRDA